VKQREFPSNNYSALFNPKTGQTLRFAIDPDKEIKPLEFPEILDISLGTICFGNCPYCYASSSATGVFYTDVVGKINRWFGSMDENQRPFQVAIGGEGEPTLHPEFIDALSAFKRLDIMPNYTTSGMFVNERMLHATKEYCGGVAVSCHKHLKRYWDGALYGFRHLGIRVNFHIIIGEENSVEYFYRLYEEYKNEIDYFVLLPYQAVGRAAKVNVEKEFTNLFTSLKERPVKNVAFGALFYDFIRKNEKICGNLDIAIYEPESLSGYVKMNTENLRILKSSYNPIPKF